MLFIILAFTIYHKLTNQSTLQQTKNLIAQALSAKNTNYIIALFILMTFNWAIEAGKWQILMTKVQKVSFFMAIKAVLSGLSFSLFAPNGIGDYFGRIVYMKEGNRLRSIAVTFVGSISQVLITLTAGLAGLIYLSTHAWKELPQTTGFTGFWVTAMMYMIGMTIMVVVFIYYRLSWLTTLVEKIPFVYKYKFLIESLESFHWKELTRILVLSFIRFIVFIVQYLLMLHIFNVQIDWLDAVCTTSVLFLVLAVLPTIPVADLGIRGETGIQLFGILSKNTGGIVFTAAGIWLLNIIIPAIAGSLFVLSIKIFRNR
ncbi:MAG TPA: lysylphosphatidylglycerol synthase domain-containing protein [Chitinophagaceae bacterium]|nr:lysylphosphatidylglycerol synthase domain-containing protein [Chitinophagaceae bacterium]